MKTHQTPSGNIPRVTFILEATASPEDKKRLRKWQHKMDKVKPGSAKAASEEAKKRGTKLHKLIKAYLNSHQVPFVEPKDYWEFWNPQLKGLLNAIEYCDVIKFEELMYCEKFAGTPDLIARIHGQYTLEKVPTIVDWKTSHRTKQRTWMEEAFIQCAAYAQLSEEKIQQLMVCVVSPGKIQIFTEEDTDKYTKLWDERLKRFYQIYELEENQF
jgi:hypothetical protein